MREDGSVLLVAVGLNDSVEHGVKSALEGVGGGTLGNQDEWKEKETGDVNSDDFEKEQRPKFDHDKAEPAYLSGHDGNAVKDAAEVTPPTQSERQSNYQQHHIDSNLINTTASSFLTRDAILETIEIPPIPQGIGRGRMTIRNFAASIDVLGPTAARTKMVVNIDPNLHFIPQSLIDFCMKRMCGVLLSRLQATARKVVKDPVKNPHSRRMREDVRFYRDWLLPKFRLYCDELGWTMPTVGAFEVSEEDLKAEGIFEGWRSNSSSHDCSGCTNSYTRKYPHHHGEETMASIYSLPVDARESTVSSTSSTGGTSTGILRQRSLRSFLREQERRSNSKRLLKIESARQQAAKRLQPKPFSESKVMRLKELKDAKLRAEKRMLARSSGNCEESVSSFATFHDFEDEGNLRQTVLILILSLALNLVLWVLQPSVQSKAPSLSNLSWSQRMRSLVAREILALFRIALQASSLWSLLNSILVFAFDSIDFGQKRIVKNLDHGKRLYFDAVRRYSFIVSASVTAISFVVAIVVSIFQISVQNLCSLLGVDGIPKSSHGGNNLLLEDSTPSSALFSVFLHCINALESVSSSVVNWVHYLALQVPVSSLRWLVFKMLYVLPGSTKRVVSAAETDSIDNLDIFSASMGICKDNTFAIESWSQKALEISSFITLRLGVFVVALLLMGHMLLPKPEKRLH